MRGIGIVLAFSFGLSGVALADNPHGKWSMADRKVTVKVQPCGENLCGRIVGLKEPTYADGKKKIDRYNENKSLRARPLMGLALLSNMKPVGENSWQGKIYNPDDGHTYSATLKLNGGEMKLQGCVAGIFCKTNTFNKVN